MLRDKHANGYFQNLPQGLVHDCDEARKPENVKKNRYKELYACM